MGQPGQRRFARPRALPPGRGPGAPIAPGAELREIEPGGDQVSSSEGREGERPRAPRPHALDDPSSGASACDSTPDGHNPDSTTPPPPPPPPRSAPRRRAPAAGSSSGAPDVLGRRDRLERASPVSQPRHRRSETSRQGAIQYSEQRAKQLGHANQLQSNVNYGRYAYAGAARRNPRCDRS